MADVALTIALAGLAGVQADLGKLTDGFKTFGTQTAKSLDDASTKFTNLGKQLGEAGGRISLLMAPVALLGAGVVKAGADFERSMNTIRVTTGSSAEQMELASEAARKLGRETTFSANEAADALNILLRNGINLTDALGGTLEATVKLAAATGTDLSVAADIVSSAMKAFGIEATNAGKATDVLYNAAIQSKFGVTDFGTALGFAQRAALPLHIAFDDLANGLASTSFAFNNASSAGTGMEQFLQRIQPQSKEARIVMEQLGLATAEGGSKFIDATGHFIGFGKAADLLRDKLGGLTPAQQQAALHQIFLNEGTSTAIALMKVGSGEVDKNKTAIDQWGTTSAAAAEMMKGFWGAVDRLGGAFDDVGIALLESGFIDGLTWIIGHIADIISWLAKMPPTLLNIIAVVLSLGTALGPVLLLLAGLSTAMGYITAAASAVATAFMTRLLPALAAVSPWFAVIAAATLGVAAGFIYMNGGISKTIDDALGLLPEKLQEVARWLGIDVPGAAQKTGDAVTDMSNPFAKEIPAATQHIENLGKSTGDMAAKAETAFNKASAAATKMADEQIKAITATEAPLEDQVLALARLGKTLEGLGKEGADGVEKVNKAISSGIAAQAAKELDFIMNRTNITIEEQSKRVGVLGQNFEKYGKLGTEGQDKIFDAAVQLNREVARNEISRITNDGTRTLEEQSVALRRLYFDYVDMGEQGVSSAKATAQALEEVNQQLRAQDDVMLGLETGLTRNIESWGGWGQQAGKVVDDFTTAATDGLTTFFMTGEISTEAFTASFLGYIAQMAAETIVHFGLMALKAIFFGETSFASSLLASTGFDIAAASAWLLDLALSPILIVVIAIAAAFALLYFAGVDIGDIFAWIAEVVGAVLKGAFQAFMAVVGALVSIFSTLIDLMGTFVGWIKTIGEELGKGDLKDLLDIFGGGNLFGGIGDIFGGIGDFFGGLFATGGWVGGSSGAVPIVAHAGEFVVNADSAARHAGLLEMINGGSDMHARVQTLGDFTGATVRDGGGSAGGPAGGGGNGGITVHMHGSVISDGLSTSQVGRTLGRSIRKETKRLLGG